MRVFVSHNAAIMCHRAPYSYYFHTPRTQMTLLRSRDTTNRALIDLILDLFGKLPRYPKHQ